MRIHSLVTLFSSAIICTNYNISFAQHRVPIEPIVELSQELNKLSADLDNVLITTSSGENENLDELLIDSIDTVNDRISLFLIQYGGKMNTEDHKGIRKGGLINVTVSEDKLLIAYSWNVGMGDRLPFYNNVVCYSSSGVSEAIFYSGILKGKQIRENFSIDRITKVQTKGHQYYLLFQTTNCASACIRNKVTACKIVSNKLIADITSFQRNDSCYNQLSFEYRLGDSQTELNFSLKYIDRDAYIIVPGIAQEIYKVNSCSTWAK